MTKKELKELATKLNILDENLKFYIKGFIEAKKETN